MQKGRSAKKDAIVTHPDDNIAVVLEDVEKGEEVRCWIKGSPCFLVVQESMAKGHKVAIQSIGRDQAVVKYGCPIGVMSTCVEKGQLVHIHNLVSSTIGGA